MVEVYKELLSIAETLTREGIAFARRQIFPPKS